MALLYLSLVAFVAAAAAVEPRITAPGCGQAPARTASSRVVGGTEADPYSWPFICSLEYSGQHICGGSLVKNLNGVYYFITAAHCLDRAARFYSVKCSIHDRLGSNPYVQTMGVSRYTNHGGYNANTFTNDISVMVLSSQPTENNYLQPVCIADSDHYESENSFIMGWGTTSEGGSASRRLLQATKPILSDAQCSSAYGSAFINSTMLCSGIYNVGGIDACQGDSGGPLVVSRNGAWVLAGVVSWGYGCARPQYPGVYADVFRMRSWIDNQIN